ncbi:MAG: DUF433 domain-containing protein [Bacteroidia bacterium]
MNCSQYIFTNPNIRFGKPFAKVNRIYMHDVLGWFAFGTTHQEIISDYTELSGKKIRPVRLKVMIRLFNVLIEYLIRLYFLHRSINLLHDAVEELETLLFRHTADQCRFTD